ncbi:MAG: helix-turn-helix domain-containing protein [Pseudomonadota bacterium]
MSKHQVSKHRVLKHRVFLLIFDRCQILDFAGASQVFTCANQYLDQGTGCFDGYEVNLISAESMVATESAITVACQPLPARLQAPYTLLLVGGPGIEAVTRSSTYRDWFRKARRRSSRWGSICTGSLALAEWGLLDGRQATTHWDSLARLASFEHIEVQNDTLFVNDGDLWTSAGISAGIDMALAMVAEDAGAIVATRAAQQMVLAAKRSGSQSQYSDLLSIRQRDPQGVFAELHEWIEEHLSVPLTVADMADFCAMSTRSLQRRYKAVLGTTPMKTLSRFRLQKARTLLGGTDVQISQVAQQCGFGSVQQFSKDFKGAFGISPNAFRQRS